MPPTKIVKQNSTCQDVSRVRITKYDRHVVTLTYYEQPSPSCKAQSIPHGLYAEGEQSSKRTRDTLRQVGTHDSLSNFRARVDGGKEKRKALSKTSLRRVQKHANCNDLAIRLDESGSNGTCAPSQERRSQRRPRAECSDG
jgi:hypothetical protein